MQMRANEGAAPERESAGAEYRLQGMDAFLSYFRAVWRALCGADRWGACLQPSPARRRHRSLAFCVLQQLQPTLPGECIYFGFAAPRACLCFPSAPLRPPAIFPPAAPGGAPLVVQTTRPGAHLCSTRPAAGALSKVDSRRW